MKDVVSNNNVYKIDSVEKINVRYYLIKIEDKSYIIDYANPKNIKNYFSVVFLKNHSQWRIYDVTGKEQDVKAKPLPFYQTDTCWRMIGCVYLAYLLHIIFLPKLNIWSLTIDSGILYNWELILAGILCGAVAIFIVLYRQKTKIQLPQQTSVLIRKHVPAVLVRILAGGAFFVYATVPLLLGIVTASYANLFLISIGVTYMLIFIKFIRFVDIKRNRYRIIEDER